MSAEPNQPVLDETSSSVSTTVPDEPKQDPDTISGAVCWEKADNVKKTEQENTSAESGTATENHVLEPNPPVVDETSSTFVTVPEEEQKQDPGTISVEKGDNAEETEQENTSAASETATENNALEQSQDTPQDNIPSKASLNSPDENPDVTSRENCSNEDVTVSNASEENGNQSASTGYVTAAELNLQEVTLYHYTIESHARSIRNSMRVKQNHPAPWPQYQNHGPGVYFTELDHGRSETDLIKNNFVNKGKGLRNKAKFIDRISYVVKITFYKRDVIKIYDGGRNLWVHRGDIDLNNYIGRYSIYPRLNPRAVL